MERPKRPVPPEQPAARRCRRCSGGRRGPSDRRCAARLSSASAIVNVDVAFHGGLQLAIIFVTASIADGEEDDKLLPEKSNDADDGGASVADIPIVGAASDVPRLSAFRRQLSTGTCRPAGQ